MYRLLFCMNIKFEWLWMLFRYSASDQFDYLVFYLFFDALNKLIFCIMPSAVFPSAFCIMDSVFAPLATLVLPMLMVLMWVPPVLPISFMLMWSKCSILMLLTTVVTKEFWLTYGWKFLKVVTESWKNSSINLEIYFAVSEIYFRPIWKEFIQEYLILMCETRIFHLNISMKNTHTWINKISSW